MSADLLALTLWREWTSGIACLGKQTENRGWWPPRSLVGRRFALHAGSHIGGRPGRVATEEGVEALATTAEGAGWSLIGWEELLGTAPALWFDRDVEAVPFYPADCGFADQLVPWRGPDAVVPIHRSAIVCTAVLLGADTEQRSPWDVPGAVHWRLGDVRRPAQPVPCKGAQGLWTVPEDVAAAVRAQGGCP